LGAEPPAGSRGRALGRGVRGRSPLKLKHFLLPNVQWKPQIRSFFWNLETQKTIKHCWILQVDFIISDQNYNLCGTMAGHIESPRKPHAARGPWVGQHCSTPSQLNRGDLWCLSRPNTTTTTPTSTTTSTDLWALLSDSCRFMPLPVPSAAFIQLYPAISLSVSDRHVGFRAPFSTSRTW